VPAPGVDAGGGSSGGGSFGGFAAGFGAAFGCGFGFVPTRTIFGSERYVEYQVFSCSTAPDEERTILVTAVERAGSP
jgi:hypothetical protein